MRSYILRFAEGSYSSKTWTPHVPLGTERMLLEFDKSELIGKARQQPGKVNMVLVRVKTDGAVQAMEGVR